MRAVSRAGLMRWPRAKPRLNAGQPKGWPALADAPATGAVHISALSVLSVKPISFAMISIPELPRSASELANSSAASGAFNRAAAFRSIAFSLVVNTLCPYLLFRFLEPRFPNESVLPLLYATIFPVIGFLFQLWRKRMMDVIALIALVGIAIHLTVTVPSPNVSVALVLRSCQGAIIGLGFLISAAIGHPVILYVARQFVAANGPQRRVRFDAVVAMDKGRAFFITTTVWGSGLIIMSAVHIALAIYIPHAEFVLISPMLGVATDVLLLSWSIRYMVRRMSGYLSAIQPAG
jgi:hypothetical protein